MLRPRSVFCPLLAAFAALSLLGATVAEARPPGPPRCESEAECQEKCPPAAVGCTCAESPRGDSICVPVCATDQDCPSHERGPNLICAEDRGICVPQHPRGEHGERHGERGRGER